MALLLEQKKIVMGSLAVLVATLWTPNLQQSAAAAVPINDWTFVPLLVFGRTFVGAGRGGYSQFQVLVESLYGRPNL